MSKIAFGKDGVETIPSIKRRIAEVTGFQYSKIEPLEASFMRKGVCTSVAFSVKGYGFVTDFVSYDMAPEYNGVKW